MEDSRERELNKLNKLYNNGLLTKEEYEIAKEKVIEKYKGEKSNIESLSISKKEEVKEQRQEQKETRVISVYKINELLNKANTSYTQNKLEEAIRDFSELIALLPSEEVHVCYYNRGLCYKKLGRIHKNQQREFYEKALFDFKKVLELKDSFQNAKLQEARILVDLGQYQESIEAYNHALEMPSQTPDSILLYERGHVYIFLKNYDKAIEDFTKCYLIDNKNIDALYNRAYIYHRHKKDLESALDDYDEILEKSPDDDIVLFARALIKHSLLEFEDCKKDLERGLKLKPNDAQHQEKFKNFLNLLEIDMKNYKIAGVDSKRREKVKKQKEEREKRRAEKKMKYTNVLKEYEEEKRKEREILQEEGEDRKSKDEIEQLRRKEEKLKEEKRKMEQKLRETKEKLEEEKRIKKEREEQNNRLRLQKQQEAEERRTQFEQRKKVKEDKFKGEAERRRAELERRKKQLEEEKRKLEELQKQWEQLEKQNEQRQMEEQKQLEEEKRQEEERRLRKREEAKRREDLRQRLIDSIINRDRLEIEKILSDCESIPSLSEEVQQAKELLQKQKEAFQEKNDIIKRNDRNEFEAYCLKYIDILSTYDLEDITEEWKKSRSEYFKNSLRDAIKEEDVETIHSILNQYIGEYEEDAQLLKIANEAKSFIDEIERASKQLQDAIDSKNEQSLELAIKEASKYKSLSSKILETKKALESTRLLSSLTEALRTEEIHLLKKAIQDCKESGTDEFNDLVSIAEEMLRRRENDLKERSAKIQPIEETSIEVPIEEISTEESQIIIEESPKDKPTKEQKQAIRALKKLYNEGEIEKKEYKRRKREILKGIRQIAVEPETKQNEDEILIQRAMLMKRKEKRLERKLVDRQRQKRESIKSLNQSEVPKYDGYEGYGNDGYGDDGYGNEYEDAIVIVDNEDDKKDKHMDKRRSRRELLAKKLQKINTVPVTPKIPTTPSTPTDVPLTKVLSHRTSMLQLKRQQRMEEKEKRAKLEEEARKRHEERRRKVEEEMKTMKEEQRKKILEELEKEKEKLSQELGLFLTQRTLPSQPSLPRKEIEDNYEEYETSNDNTPPPPLPPPPPPSLPKFGKMDGLNITSGDDKIISKNGGDARATLLDQIKLGARLRKTAPLPKKQQPRDKSNLLHALQSAIVLNRSKIDGDSSDEISDDSDSDFSD